MAKTRGTRPVPAASNAPKGRGRATKAVASSKPEPQPKKRGRAAKAKVEEPVAEVAGEESSTRGRRSRKEPVVEEASVPKKRAGRPRKENAVAEQELATPSKRRGRPPKNAVDLNRVAGSPRVNKRTSTGTKAGKRKAPAAAPASRTNPIVRSKLRTRAPAAPKPAPVADAPKPKKRLGRPPKTVAAAPTKKTAERKTQGARVTKPATQPRKRRGYTQLDIPDKYVKDVKGFLKGLIDADEAAAAEAKTQAAAVAEAVVEENVGEDNDNYNAEEAEASELPQNDVDEDVDGGAEEQGDENGIETPEGAAKIVRDVEMVIDVERSADEDPDAAKAAAEVIIIQEEITEIVSPVAPQDEPDSLFDDLQDESVLAATAAGVDVPIAPMMPATLI